MTVLSLLTPRESTESDIDFLYQLHHEAFGSVEGPAVANLVINLLQDDTAIPSLSLVVESDGELLGHILFTPVSISPSACLSGYILCPLAVARSAQGRSVGTTLISVGVARLAERGAGFVLVLGDPAYYKRFGFKAGHGIKPPYELHYPEAWMTLELRVGALDGVEGFVQCAKSLHSPEYW